MFKKLTAFVLAFLFVFAAFGVSTVFNGTIVADAVYYDYYEYTSLPGWIAFTEQDLDEIYTEGFDIQQVAAPAQAPEKIDKATQFTVVNTNAGQYANHMYLTSYIMPNLGEIHEGGEPINVQWAAKKYPSSGATIMGDYDFSNASGICFWLGKNDSVYTGKVTINIFAVPSKSVYYTGDDTAISESTPGFCFAAEVYPDEDGYVYLDFKTDFYQVDWYWLHDDGKNYNCLGGEKFYLPLPLNMRHLINGMSINLISDTVGDQFYIGDLCAYSDTRVHIDGLSDVIDHFDSLNPEAYTEESYTAATEVYLRAYDILLDENLAENYTQKDVDLMEDELQAAIAALKPLFPVRDRSITLNGFDSLTEADLDTIMEGGVSLDMVGMAEGYGPTNCDFALEVIANGDPGYNPPYYGWSSFSTLADNGDGPVAVGNVFGADMSSSAGLRFWIKNPVDTAPLSMQILVGKAGEAEFIAEDYSIIRPLAEGEEGYVSVSWISFFDYNDEGYDIFDYLGELDYITIQFDDLRGTTYMISDLHAFNWSMQNADLTELNKAIAEGYAYLSTLNKNAFTPRSWARVVKALAEGEAIINVYAITQEEVDAATEEIRKAINGLTPIDDGPTQEELNYLETLVLTSKTYWRGNYVPTSYNALDIAIKDADTALEYDMTKEKWAEYKDALLEAVTKLIPITHGGTIEKGFYSFESYTSRDFSKTTGDRTEGVNYSLVKRTNAAFLPEGYDQALKMETIKDLSSEETDEHGNLQFKAMYRELGSPKFIKPSNGDPLVGDLTGSDGVRVWIAVNDVNLVQNGTFRIGISNCHKSPLFEMHAVDIPLPATGSGWLYIPWNYFEFYDAWTNGEPIRLNDIGFYIFRFDGKIKQGLEVYITGLQAYTNTGTTTNEQPVVNITDGQTIDVSAGAFTPEWNIGGAILDNAYFPYGSSINTNGDHTLVITNADKSTTVNFTVVGGVDQYTQPVVNGVSEGGKYTSTTITWDVGTATLNGETFARGTTVDTPGEYRLIVTNGLVSNGGKVTTINFTIIKEEPAVKKGDFDGDGKITVSDALAALRIAAKMVEETADDIAIGDIDADGKITVSDSLAILRVAAKMADEDTL